MALPAWGELALVAAVVAGTAAFFLAFTVLLLASAESKSRLGIVISTVCTAVILLNSLRRILAIPNPVAVAVRSALGMPLGLASLIAGLVIAGLGVWLLYRRGVIGWLARKLGSRKTGGSGERE